MANQRLTDKTELAEQVGSGDLLMVVDVNDTTGSSAGTSKKQDFKYLMQTDKISLSNAEILDLETNEKVLVGALSGYMITVFNVTVLCTHNMPTESARRDIFFGFEDTSDSVYWSKIDDIMDSIGEDVSYVTQAQDQARSYSSLGSLINKPFVCWAQNSGFNGGWTADVYVTYAYTKVL